MAEIPVVDFAPELLAAPFQSGRLIHDQDGLFDEIVEEGVHAGIQIRCAPFCIHRDGSEGVQRCLGPQVFPCWQDDRSIQLLDGFLRGGIEEAERVDGFAEKLCPQRVGIGRRKNIDNAASNTELSWNFHHRDLPIAEA